MATILRQRRDTAANWTSANPVIPDGQLCFDTTNDTFRIGDGTTTYGSLPVQSGTAGDMSGSNNLSEVVSASTALTNLGLTSTAAELNILDGVTSTAAELNILDGVTSTTAELNILDGVTSTAAELNILDGVTSTAAELNILDGVTSTAAELNILDGVTSTAAELNILDGVTASTTELNYTDGVTSLIQNQLDTMALKANDLSDLASASTARTNLGLAIGTDVQAHDSTIVVDADIGSTVGYLNIPKSGTSKTASYTLATTDIGELIEVGSSGSITIPDSVFSTGDVVLIFNNTGGDVTLTCSITTAYIGGTDTDEASITLATRGICNVLFISPTVCVVTGNIS